MSLSIAHLYPTDDQVVLALCGSLDERAASHLRDAIDVEARRVPRPACIVVDLTEVDHVDPGGVGSLVAGNRSCALAGVRLAVRGPSPLVRGLLRAGAPDRPARARRCLVRPDPLHGRWPRPDTSGPPGRTALGARPRRPGPNR